MVKQCNYLDNGSHVIWDYCLLVLNPLADPSSVSNKQKAKKMNWAQELTIDFLNSIFKSNIDGSQSIGSAVLKEINLMIVACRRAQKQILPEKLYSIYNAKDDAMALATACFCHGTEAQVGKATVMETHNTSLVMKYQTTKIQYDLYLQVLGCLDILVEPTNPGKYEETATT